MEDYLGIIGGAIVGRILVIGVILGITCLERVPVGYIQFLTWDLS